MKSSGNDGKRISDFPITTATAVPFLKETQCRACGQRGAGNFNRREKWQRNSYL